MIIRPLINEKSFALIKQDLYTFEVSKDATKRLVARLVAEKFKVNPISVNIVNLPKKSKMQRTKKGYYQTSGSKKAIVRVKKGQKIAIFEVANAEPEEEVVVTTGEGELIAKTKEKKSLLGRTKVKIEKELDPGSRTSGMTVGGVRDDNGGKPRRTRQQAGKTKGEK